MSSFLEKLKKSLEEGTPDESVKKTFDDIVSGAEKYNYTSDQVEKRQEEIIKNTKPLILTEEQVKEFQEKEKLLEEKQKKFEQEKELTGYLVNISLAKEKLEGFISDLDKYKDEISDPKTSNMKRVQIYKNIMELLNKIDNLSYV